MNHWEVLRLGGHLMKRSDLYPYNIITTLIPPIQRSSGHLVSMVTLVTLVTIVPTPRGVGTHAPLTLCLMNIISRVGWTGISITLIPLRSRFLLSPGWWMSSSSGQKPTFSCQQLLWNIVMNDWNFNEKSIGKWQ